MTKPASTKLAAGNLGHRPINENEPVFPKVTTYIEPPEHMTEEAAEMWARACPHLIDQKLLTWADLQVLEVYCDAYGAWREALREIALDGPTVTLATGSLQKHPALTAKKEASDTMHRFGGLLGLDPVNRQKLQGPGDGPDADPLSSLA